MAWRDDRKGKTDALALKQLLAKSTAPDAPLTLTVDATYNGVAFKLGGKVGPLDRLQQPDADMPWPVKLTLAAAGATVAVDGALTHPLQGRGYSLTLDGTIPDLTAIAPLLRNTKLPPLHDIHLAAQIADSGGPVPRVEAATLHLGPADLGAYVSGLHVVSLDIDAPKQDQPVRINAQATMADTPLTLSATVGLPSALVSAHPVVAPQAPEPVPLDVTLQAANASLTVKGTVAHPETLSGADLALDATIPDLNLLSPLAHRMLPAVTQIAFQGRLTDATGGFRHGAALHDVKLTSADGDLSGDIAVDEGPPRALTGKLHAGRIDADALLAAVGKPVTACPPRPRAPPVRQRRSASLGQRHCTSRQQRRSAICYQRRCTARHQRQSTSHDDGAPPSASGGAAPAAAVVVARPPSPTAHRQPRRAIRRRPPVPPHRSLPAATGCSRIRRSRSGCCAEANADLGVVGGRPQDGRLDYRLIDLHVVVQDGKLRLAPFVPRIRRKGGLTPAWTWTRPHRPLRRHNAACTRVWRWHPCSQPPACPATRAASWRSMPACMAPATCHTPSLPGWTAVWAWRCRTARSTRRCSSACLDPVLKRAKPPGLLLHGGFSDRAASPCGPMCGTAWPSCARSS